MKTITLAVPMATEDFRSLLYHLVDAVVDDVCEMTPRLSDAVKRAKVALEEGVQ